MFHVILMGSEMLQVPLWLSPENFLIKETLVEHKINITEQEVGTVKMFKSIKLGKLEVFIRIGREVSSTSQALHQMLKHFLLGQKPGCCEKSNHEDIDLCSRECDHSS